MRRCVLFLIHVGDSACFDFFSSAIKMSSCTFELTQALSTLSSAVLVALRVTHILLTFCLCALNCLLI